MAIQHRRGKYSKFDPNKMVAGEWAVVQEGQPGVGDGEAVYMAFQTGNVKRMATYEDMVDNIEEATNEAVAESTAEAEAWAVGQRNGADVDSSDEAYRNNAKYYAQEAGKSEANAKASEIAAESHKNAAATSAIAATEAAETSKEYAESAEKSAQDAAGAAGSKLYSIGRNPTTGRLALYYNGD